MSNYQIATKSVMAQTDANFTINRGEFATLFANHAADDAPRDAIQIEIIVTPTGRVIIATNGIGIQLVDFNEASQLMALDDNPNQLPLLQPS